MESEGEYEEMEETSEKSASNLDSFHNKECNKFVPSTSLNKDETMLYFPCFCGEFAIYHREPSLQDESSENIVDGNISFNVSSPTKSYGEITFSSPTFPRRTKSEFLRISDDDYDEAFTHMWETIDLRQSEFWISIISSPNNWKIEPIFLKRLTEGILEAAKRSNAMITLSGLDTEPMECISQALWSYNFLSEIGSKEVINFYAVMPWGDVNDRNKLETNPGSSRPYVPTTYSNALPGLSRYHNHFIFVDDGYRHFHHKNRMNEFLVNFENAGNNYLLDATWKSVSVVALLIGGDYKSLMSISARIDNGLPTVVCGGTGYAADVLHLVKSWTDNQQGISCLQLKKNVKQLTKLVGDLENAPHFSKEVIDLFTKILNNSELVTLYHLSDGDDLPNVIFTGIMRKATMSNFSKAMTAILWHRPEIITDMLSKDPYALEKNELAYIVYQPSNMESFEIIEICRNFITDYSFINNVWLLEFYGKYTTGLERMISTVRKRKYKNADISNLLIKLMSKIFGVQVASNMLRIMIATPKHKDGEEPELHPLNEPFENLFIWAVTAGNVVIAESLWSFIESPLCMALMACHLFRVNAKSYADQDDLENEETYIAHADYFEDLAIELANETFKTNNVVSINLMGSARIEKWESLSVLQLASIAGCKKFISTLPCQRAVEALWTRNVQCNTLVTIGTIICPLLVLSPTLIKFNRTNTFTIDTDPPEPSLPAPTKFIGKVKTFYQSPRAKFYGNFIFFFAFLMLASFNLLFIMLDAKVMNIIEWIVYILMFTRLLGSIILSTIYMRVIWLQLISGTLAIISFVLRVYGESFFTASYTVYACAIMLMYLELLEYLLISVRFGSRIIMIGQMLIEMIRFLPFFVVFIIGFGVAEQVTLYPYRTGFSARLLMITYLIPIYRVFGENALTRATGDENCTDKTEGYDCANGNWFTLILIAVYVMLMTVVLMNLLIAIISDVFEQLNSESIMIWKKVRYDITKEYHQRSIMPWPFGIIFDFYHMIKGIIKRQLESNIQLTWRQKILYKIKKMQRSGSETEAVATDESPKEDEQDISVEQKEDEDEYVAAMYSTKMQFVLENMCRNVVVLRRQQAESETVPGHTKQIENNLTKMEEFITTARNLMKMSKETEVSDESDNDEFEDEEQQLETVKQVQPRYIDDELHEFNMNIQDSLLALDKLADYHQSVAGRV